MKTRERETAPLDDVVRSFANPRKKQTTSKTRMRDIVELNVGGTHFTTTRQTLTQRVSEVSAENRDKCEPRNALHFFFPPSQRGFFVWKNSLVQPEKKNLFSLFRSLSLSHLPPFSLRFLHTHHPRIFANRTPPPCSPASSPGRSPPPRTPATASSSTATRPTSASSSTTSATATARCRRPRPRSRSCWPRPSFTLSTG